MKLIEGGSLADRIEELRKDRKKAVPLMAKVAWAVHYAHQRGILHRDLKPANILIDKDGQPHVTDFGLAKKVAGDSGMTQSGAVVGTPSYMAPEQAAAKKGLTTEADVYSLGAILYELLTGQPPFRGPTQLETLMLVMKKEPARPRTLDRTIDRDLETIVLKCLAKEPAQRYASAEALAEDLRRFSAGEAVRAQPPSLRYVLGKQIRRYRTPLAVAAGVLLLLAAVVTTAFVLLLGAWNTARTNFETADKNGKDLARKQGELQDALDGQKRQLSVSARIAASRSDAEYRAGNLRDSLNWMLQAYELAPREDPLRHGYVRRIGERARGLSDLALWHDRDVQAAVFSPDGRMVLTASWDNTARLWDTATGKELHRLQHDDNSDMLHPGVNAASFSPDGRTVVTASWDRTARLWDAASGKELQRLPHDDVVLAASFSPDGRTVVTASWDKTARLWDAATGKELQRLTHDDGVNAASFSPDGRTVVTASGDKTARLWDAATGKELQRLTHDGSRCRRRRSAPTAARSSPPAGGNDRPPGCGTPPAERSCNGSRMRMGCWRRRSAPTAARSSPPAGTRRPGCGTPPAERSCNG